MAELTFNTSLGVPVTSGDGIYYYAEIPPTSEIETFRVRSSLDGDFFFSRRFHKIKATIVQNHGATFASGVVRDPPQITVTQGANGNTAKITINHTATAEFFSIKLYGLL